MNNSDQDWDQWVKKERKRRGLSQEDLAEKSGVCKELVSHVERGMKVGHSSLCKVVQALGHNLGAEEHVCQTVELKDHRIIYNDGSCNVTITKTVRSRGTVFAIEDAFTKIIPPYEFFKKSPKIEVIQHPKGQRLEVQHDTIRPNRASFRFILSKPIRETSSELTFRYKVSLPQGFVPISMKALENAWSGVTVRGRDRHFAGRLVVGRSALSYTRSLEVVVEVPGHIADRDVLVLSAGYPNEIAREAVNGSLKAKEWPARTRLSFKINPESTGWYYVTWKPLGG